MRLGINMSYWGAANDAEDLWIAPHTERMDVGSAIFQIPARTPAMTAMTWAWACRARRSPRAAGPHPRVRGDRPQGSNARTSDVRWQALPPAAAGRSGQGGEADVHPVRELIPVYLAAIGPDELGATVPLVMGDDMNLLDDLVRWYTVQYIGGWAARSRTSTTSSPTGWGSRRPPTRSSVHTKDFEGAAAVPFECVDTTSPWARRAGRDRVSFGLAIHRRVCGSKSS
jgi:hypothetical protein